MSSNKNNIDIVNKKESHKSYFIGLDILRIFLCIVILMYHLGYMPGGYLAVCSFFVLSGYLAYYTASRDDNFSIKNYYLKRIKNLYVPLVLTVFLSLFSLSFIKNLGWLNLKPETTSVLFGYNNFWQLGASLDYFSRHIDSPFMHLWYISILMQFDLVFPFIYKFFNKVKTIFHKSLPAIITFSFGILSFALFYVFSLKYGMMIAYYNTFLRLFSLLFGLLLAIIHLEKVSLIPEVFKEKSTRIIIIFIYFMLLLVFFLIVPATSNLFQISMLIVTIITCRLIDYITCKKTINKNDHRLLKYISSLTYIIYLVQYPVIFIFGFTTLHLYVRLLLVIVTTLTCSLVLSFALSFYKKDKLRIFRIIVLIVLSLMSLKGVYTYIVSKDYSAEMRELEKMLNENQKMIKIKQEDYTNKIKEAEEALNKKLEDIENDKNNIEKLVKELPVVGIGDSVMLGAVNNLYELFPNGYFDAQISRTAWVVNGIMEELDNKNMLGDPIVINMGANGDCNSSCKDEIMKTANGRKVFWVTTTNSKTLYVNDNVKSYAEGHDNMYVIDWYAESLNHDDYFYADGIHLTIPGRVAYSDTIYKAIYDVYVEEYSTLSEKTVQAFKDEIKNKLTFYGNDLLLSSYQYMADEFIDSKFNINSNYTYDILKNEFAKKYNSGELSTSIALVFDSSFKMSEKQLTDLVNSYPETMFYLAYDGFNNKINADNIKYIDFNIVTRDNSNKLSDGIHLNAKGSELLAKIFIEYLKVS